MTPSERYRKIIENVQSMVDQQAPASHIDGYLKLEGLTPEQFKSVVEGPTVLGQAKEVVKGIIPGAVGLLESAAVGASSLLPESMEAPVRERIKSVAESARAPFAAQPGYEDTEARKYSEALGSVGPFLALGPLGLAGRAAMVGLGAGAGAGEARVRAEQEGGMEQRGTATALGAGVGVTEALPIFAILNRLSTPIRDGVFSYIRRAAVAGGQEGAQEAAASVLQDLVAKGLYKPEQVVGGEALEEAGYGTAVGATVQALVDLALGRRSRGTQTSSTSPDDVPAGTPPGIAPSGQLQLPLAIEAGTPPDTSRTDELEQRAALESLRVRSDQLRGEFDLLQDENNRLQSAFERSEDPEEKAQLLEQAQDLAPKLRALRRSLQGVESQLPQEERGRVQLPEGQMQLFEQEEAAPAKPTAPLPATFPTAPTEQLPLFGRIPRTEATPESKAAQATFRAEDQAARLEMARVDADRLRGEFDVLQGENIRLNNIFEQTTDPVEREKLFTQGEELATQLRAVEQQLINTEKQLPKEERGRVPFPEGQGALFDESLDVPEPPPPKSRPVTEDDFKDMNIAPANKTLRKEILGKDLNDTIQREEVQRILEEYGSNPNRSPRIATAVERFLSQPPFTEGTPDVEPPTTGLETGGTGIQVPRGPRSRASTQRVEPSVERGVGDVEPSVGESAGGTGTPQPSVAPTAAPQPPKRKAAAPAAPRASWVPPSVESSTPPVPTQAAPAKASETAEERARRLDREIKEDTNKLMSAWKPKFRPVEQTPPKNTIPKAKLDALVAQIEKALGGRVNIVVADSVTDVMPEEAPGTRAGALAQNQVYLFRDGIADGIEGEKTILHELFHKGLSKLFSPTEYDRLMEMLYGIQSVKATTDRWLASPDGAEARIAYENQYGKSPKTDLAVRNLGVEEVLAKMAETESRLFKGMLPKLRNWMARVLDSIGLKNLARWVRNAGLDEYQQFFRDAINASVDGTKNSPDSAFAAYARQAEPSTEQVDRPPVFATSASAEAARALNERMKGISNPKEKAADETIAKRLANNFKFKDAIPVETRIRRVLVDKSAPVVDKVAAEFNNAVTDELTGTVRADLLLAQKQDIANLGDKVVEQGGIRISETGLIEVVDRPATMDKVLSIIVEKLGAKVGGVDEAMQLAHNALIGFRASEIRKNNEAILAQAEAAEAKRNKRAAKLLRDKVINLTATDEQIDAALEAMATFPEIREAYDTFTEFKNGLVDFLQASGRINSETAKNWKENLGYVPWTRVEEEANKFELELQPKRGAFINLSKLPHLDTEGSSKEINNIFDNMVGTSLWLVRSGIENYSNLKVLEALPDAKLLETPDAVAFAQQRQKERLVFVYKDGEKEAYLLGSPYDLATFTTIPTIKTGIIGNTFVGAAQLLRTTITHMPAFAIGQLIQDGTYRAMLLSGVQRPFALPPKVFKNFFQLVFQGQSAAANDLARLGVTGMYDGMPDKVVERIKQRAKIEHRNAFKRAWDGLEQFSLNADLAVRAAIYEQTMKESGDRNLAYYRAKEYINFKRQGLSPTVNTLRQVIPFMNAYMQGMDVLYRTIVGKGVTTGERKAALKLFYMTGAKLAALNLIYAMAVGGDDEYEGLDEYARNRNYIIPGTGVRIPVAPEVGLFFKVLPEQLYRYMSEEGTTGRSQDTKAFMKRMGDAVGDAIGGVGYLPAAVKPALEVAVNYSFFREGPVVGRGMEQIEKPLQFTENTSELSKVLGQLSGQSPIVIDHLLRGYTGMASGILLDLTDGIINPDRMSKPLYKVPQVSSFMYNPTGRGFKTDFYDFRENVSQVVDTFNMLAREGRAEELERYLTPETVQVYAMKGVVAKVERDLSKMRQYRKIIASDTTIPSDERAKKVEELLLVERDLVRAYNIPQMRRLAGY